MFFEEEDEEEDEEGSVLTQKPQQPSHPSSLPSPLCQRHYPCGPLQILRRPLEAGDRRRQLSYAGDSDG